MGHLCGSTCKRKTGIACQTRRSSGKARVALIAAISNGRDRGDDQSRLVETLRQTVEALAIENARLRQRNGNGNPPPQAPPGE